MLETILGTFKELAIATAAVVTAVAAFKGLRTWQRETEWRENREVARNLVRNTFKVRDSLNHVRNPLIRPYEFPKDWDPRENHTPEVNSQNTAYVYENRLKVLRDAMQELEVAVLEAEVFWGPEVESRMRGVRSCRSRLIVSLEQHISNLRSGHMELRDNHEQQQKVHNDIYRSPGDQDDLSVSIQDALNSVLEVAQPHLKR